jgi:hypothetical protein
MRPMQQVYALRIVLGIVAAFLCIGYGLATGTVDKVASSNITMLLNGMSIAIITYIVSYYVMRRHFALIVEKPQKIFTMGIGIYFLSWIVFWVLLFTIITGP